MTGWPVQGTAAWVAAQTTASGIVVLWELTSGAGGMPVVSCALTSPTGRAVSVSANATTSGEFGYARDGVMLASASSRVPGELRGEQPDVVRPVLERAGVALDDLWASDCLVLVEELFGLTVAPPAADEPVLVAQINPFPGAHSVAERAAVLPCSVTVTPVTGSPASLLHAVRRGRAARPGVNVAGAARLSPPDPGPES